VDWSTTTRRHGTTPGYSLHQELGERPCDACSQAKREYDQRLKSAPEQVRKQRLRASAQWAALKRLAHEESERYHAFYQEELSRRLRGEQP
jgi:hypothetical protein